MIPSPSNKYKPDPPPCQRAPACIQQPPPLPSPEHSHPPLAIPGTRWPHRGPTHRTVPKHLRPALGGTQICRIFLEPALSNFFPCFYFFGFFPLKLFP